jgi:hypothetical protein
MEARDRVMLSTFDNDDSEQDDIDDNVTGVFDLPESSGEEQSDAESSDGEFDPDAAAAAEREAVALGWGKGKANFYQQYEEEDASDNGMSCMQPTQSRL